MNVMSGNIPFFSIIIPALNEEKYLPLLLNSLAKQQDPDFEVIVVDGGSTDQTAREAKKFESSFSRFLYHKEALKNVSSSRNIGARLAKAQWLLFLDADVMVEPNFTRETKTYIMRKKPNFVTFLIKTKDQVWSGKIMCFLINFGIFFFQKISSLANGTCIGVRKSVFNEARGFNENAVVAEDIDFSRRATRLCGRYSFLFSPAVYVSSRRYQKEGFWMSLYKALKGTLYVLLIGPVTKPLYEYKMGGHNFAEQKNGEQTVHNLY